MADFSTQATNVQGPEAQGSQPIAPVNENLTPPAWGQALAQLGQEVGNIAGGMVVQQKKKDDNTFLGQLAQQQALINQGVSQGSISTVEADTRTRALYNQNLAARPDLAKQIGSLFNTFQNTTQAGDIQDAKKEAADRRKTDLNSAASNGIYISPNATQAQQDAIIRANQSNILMQKQLEEQRKQAAEQRAQEGHNLQMTTAQHKEDNARLLAQVGSDNLNSFNAQIEDLRTQVQQQKMTPQDAQLELNRRFATYQQTLSAIAGQTPELASGYQNMFRTMFEAGNKYLDPKNDAENFKAQKDAIIAKAQVVQLSGNPQYANIVATSQLLGPSNPALSLLTNSPAVINMIKSFSNPTSNGRQTDVSSPIVSTANEATAIDFLRKSIRGINTGGFTDAAKAKIEATNGVNNMLAEMGRTFNNGADPKQLTGLANFFASDEYGSLVKSGMIDVQAQQAAQKVFQISYMPSVTNAIGARLNQDLVPASQDGTQPAISLAKGMDIQNVNGVLTFVPSPNLKLTPEQQKLEQSTIKNLQEVQGALNTMVKLGMNMEGTSDFNAHWEKNKYYYLPQLYPVKPGQVVGNLKWSGNGDWRDQSTWQRVGQR